jgi:hypothetical protein
MPSRSVLILTSSTCTSTSRTANINNHKKGVVFTTPFLFAHWLSNFVLPMVSLGNCLGYLNPEKMV